MNPHQDEEEIPLHPISRKISRTTNPETSDSQNYFALESSSKQTPKRDFSLFHPENFSFNTSYSENVSVSVSVHHPATQLQSGAEMHPKMPTKVMNEYKQFQTQKKGSEQQTVLDEHIETACNSSSSTKQSELSRVQNLVKLCDTESICKWCHMEEMKQKEGANVTNPNLNSKESSNNEKATDRLVPGRQAKLKLKSTHRPPGGGSVTPYGTPVLPSSLHGSGVRQRISPYSASSTPSPNSLTSSSHSGSRNHRSTLEDIKEDTSSQEDGGGKFETKVTYLVPQKPQISFAKNHSTPTQLHARDVFGNPLASQQQQAAKGKSNPNSKVNFKGKPKIKLQSAESSS